GRPPLGAVPVETVAAEAGADLVRLGAVLRLAAPDGEQPQEQTLVGDAVEVVELRLDLQVVALGVEAVGADPRHRLARLPRRALDDVGVLAVVARPARGARAKAVDPDLAEG